MGASGSWAARAVRRVRVHRLEALALLAVLAAVTTSSYLLGVPVVLARLATVASGGRLLMSLLVGFGALWLPLMVIDMRRCTRETALREQVEADLRVRLSAEQRDAAEEAAIRSRVQEIIAGGGPRVAFQPIVDLRTGRWTALEALARFPDGRAPDLWFAEAERLGLGVPLEVAMLAAVGAAMAVLPPATRVAVNVSPAFVVDDAFLGAVVKADIDLRRMTLEVTEHAAVEDYARLAAALAPLRRRGVSLAVDDAGAGYSSFNHVLCCRPDVIKLDRSLVAGVDGDPARRAFVSAVVLLARDLGARVTAEGVETTAELDTVVALGVDNAQGYLFGRPTQDPEAWAGWDGANWAIVSRRPHESALRAADSPCEPAPARPAV